MAWHSTEPARHGTPVGCADDNVVSEARNGVEVGLVTAVHSHDTARLVEANVVPLHGACLHKHHPVHLASLQSSDNTFRSCRSY